MAAAVETDAEIQQQLTNEVKLFNRWSYEDVSVTDISLVDYIGVQPAKHANTADLNKTKPKKSKNSMRPGNSRKKKKAHSK